MAVTRLKRKAKRNKMRAKQRKTRLKHLLATPVIKNITTTQEATPTQA